MCGKETQMFHFLSAFSSGEYITSFTGLFMSKGGSCSSTVKGYHFLACAYAPKLANASTALAATAPATTTDGFMPTSSILSGSSPIRPLTLRCTSCPKPINHYPYRIFRMSIVLAPRDRRMSETPSLMQQSPRETERRFASLLVVFPKDRVGRSFDSLV